MASLLNNSTVGKTIVGHRLAKRLKSISADYRALLAHRLVTGEVVLHHLSKVQASTLVRVSLPYVNTVSRASPEQREAIKRRWLSVARLYTKRRRELTDAQVDRIVRRIGPDRMWSAMERTTRPQPQRVAEE
jgi:hypothetical protein